MRTLNTLAGKYQPYVPGGMKPSVAVTNHAPAVTRKDVPAPQVKVTPKPTGGIAASKHLPGGGVVDYGRNPNAKPGASKKLPVPPGMNGGAGNKPVAPKAPATAPKPATGMAGLFGGLGPNAYINSLYAPQETALANQQANRQAALHSMVTEFLNSLNSNTASLAPYTNSASQQMSDANNAAAGLAAANPNAVTQNDLAAINAPQAQRSQVAGQNNTAFGGNAALLQYTGGVIPSDQFRDDAAARASYLATLPALGESLGLRGLNSIDNLASKENSDLATSKAGDLLKARNDLATYVQGNQKLKAAAAKTAFDENATTTRLNQSQNRIDLTSQMDAFNQKYKINTYNLSVDRLNQSASKFAYQQFKDNRSYTLQLKKYGLQKASAQRAAIAQEYKLANGGFSATKILQLRTSAFNISQNAFNGGGANGPFYKTGPNKGKPITPVNYQTAVKEMRSAGVPISIAVPELNKLYKPGQRGRPLTDNGTTSFGFGSNSVTGGNQITANKSGGGFLPSGAKYVQGRADQGRDFQTDPGGPIIAPGSGYVIAVKSDPHGFGPAYPIVHFTSGPYAGQDMYIGHTISALKSGAKFNAGMIISRTGTSPLGNASVPGWAEIGFAPGGMPGQFGQHTPFG